MNENEKKEIMAMLAVIYKRLQKLENPSNTKMFSPQTFIDELRKEANEIKHQISG